MARAIFFIAIIALVAMHSRETFARTTVNPLMADHEIVQHTGGTVSETTENSAIADTTIAEHTGAGRLRACVEIFSAASSSVLRFCKRIAGARVRPYFALGLLATAAMHAHNGGVGAHEIICHARNQHVAIYDLYDPKLGIQPTVQHITPLDRSRASFFHHHCRKKFQLPGNHGQLRVFCCNLRYRCIEGYVWNGNGVCVSRRAPIGRQLELLHLDSRLEH